jgi:hypothetical protein
VPRQRRLGPSRPHPSASRAIRAAPTLARPWRPRPGAWRAMRAALGAHSVPVPLALWAPGDRARAPGGRSPGPSAWPTHACVHEIRDPNRSDSRRRSRRVQPWHICATTDRTQADHAGRTSAADDSTPENRCKAAIPKVGFAGPHGVRVPLRPRPPLLSPGSSERPARAPSSGFDDPGECDCSVFPLPPSSILNASERTVLACQRKSRTPIRARILSPIFAANGGISRDATAPCGISPSPSAREGCSASTTNGVSIAPLGRAPGFTSSGSVSLDVVVHYPGLRRSR